MQSSSSRPDRLTTALEPKWQDDAVDDDNVLEDPVTRNRRLSATVGATPSWSRASSQTTTDASLSSAASLQVSRHAVVELPLMVVVVSSQDTESDNNKGNNNHQQQQQVRLQMAPHARLAVQSQIPLGSLTHWSARVQASAVVRGPNGYTTHDAALQYQLGDVNLKVPVHKNLWSNSIKTTTTPSSSSSIRTTALSLRHTRLTAGLHTVRNRSAVYVGAAATVRPDIHVTVQGGRRQAHVAVRRQYPHGSLSSGWRWSRTTVHTTTSGYTLAWSASTIHPWRIQWGWHPSSMDKAAFMSWQWSTQPAITAWQRLRLAVGLVRPGVWSIRAALVQPVRRNHYNASNRNKQPTLQGSVAVAYQAARGGIQWIFSWQHGDFTVNLPVSWIGADGAKVPRISSHAVLDNFVTSLLLASLSKLLQDGIAWLCQLDQVAATSTASQQEQARQKQQDARTEASQQQALMQRQATSRTRAEQEARGLLIHSATYFIQGSSDPNDTWDVTVPLQFWVTNSTLELPTGSKRSLLGFVDLVATRVEEVTTTPATVVPPLFSREWWQGFVHLPLPAARARSAMPRLRVVYEYRGQRHQVVVADEEKLVLPTRS